MENASKAMLMAAGVLIGILILSLAVYLFISFGSNSAEIHQQNAQQQMDQFNSQFTSYQGKECTIYDVITIANLATENNKYYEFDQRFQQTAGNDYYISVKLDGKGLIDRGANNPTDDIRKEYNQLIQTDLDGMGQKTVKDAQTGESITYEKALPGYKCIVHISPSTQRVYYVQFEKITR